MTITAESLSPITHNQIPVITTELLAKLYATKPEYVRRNHRRNPERFIECKHYFIAKGETLEILKESLRPFQCLAPNVRKLILWTERGAARHAKMLETDQAWEVFERLEDCYFNQRPPVQTPIPYDDPLSEPAYRREAMRMFEGVLSDCAKIASNQGVPLPKWKTEDMQACASGLLAYLLRDARAELRFDNDLNISISMLPRGAMQLLPDDPECMRQLVRYTVNEDVLREMISAGLSRLGVLPH